ncbi:MAG: hypothetical protein HKN08_03965 [Gammaproteobacteria bacterium]|nr:hypothetical protein [Gammaproteobacteria bacterium]
MLQIIRNLFTGWIAVLFIALLIIPFAFWGITSYFGSAANIEAANVNGESISLAEYQSSYQNIRRQFQNISPQLAEDNEFIKQQTLDKLIDRILLQEIKQDLGLRVSNDQIRQAILEIPNFRNPEGFDTVAYNSFLLRSGMTAPMFEAEMRDDLSLEQLQTGLLQTTIATPHELRRLAAIESETRNIRYATIEYDDFKEGVDVTQAEIQADYDQNSARYIRPEQVKLAYIQLSIDDVAQEVTVEEGDLETYFDTFRDNYSITERRKVRQILVYSEGEEDRETAETIANQIFDQVANSGVTFDEVRTQYDNDEITVEVSDFGFLNQGVLDPEVDEVVFNTEIGVLNEPIQTDYGYQIVIVDEVTGGDGPELSEVRGEVETDYRRNQAERRFFELYDELAVLTYENPDTLDIASDALGLPVQESDYLSRTGGANLLLNNQKILSAAFSDDVLNERNNSELIEIDTDQIMVIRVIDHQQQRIMELSEVENAIREKLLFDKVSALTADKGSEIVEKIRQGGDSDSVAEEYSIIWTNKNEVGRTDMALNDQLLQSAFAAENPAEGEVSVAGTPLITGDYAIVVIQGVNDIDPESLADEDIAEIFNRVMQNNASRTWSNILTDLRADADIEIFEDNLN